MAHGRYSLNVGGMNEFLRGCHLFNKPFFCSPLQHNFVGLLCYKTSVARREREGEWCRKASLLQREADVSVYWLMASACGKMFYRAGCCVSNKNASPLSEMPEVQRCLGTFQRCRVFFWLKLIHRNLDKILYWTTWELAKLPNL